MSKTIFKVYCEYPAKLFMDTNIEQQIRDIEPVGGDGSGMGFGCRDIDWTVESEEQAKTFVQQLQQINPIIEAHWSTEQVDTEGNIIWK